MHLFDQFLAAIADAEAGVEDGDRSLAVDGLDQVRELIASHPELAAELSPALAQAELRVAAWFDW